MVENQRRYGGIDTPEYLFYEVFFYPGMVFGNLAGFVDSHAQPLGTLAHVFNQLCTQARIASWGQDVFVRPGGWAYGGFRTLMQRLRVPVHAEVVSGLSYRRLASLDVFMAIHTAAMGMGPPPMALWTVSNEDADGIQHYPQQDQWWHMPVWRPADQWAAWWIKGSGASNIIDYQAVGRMHPNSRAAERRIERAADAAAERRKSKL